MTETGNQNERQLRWIETPIGRGVVNGVALVVLLSLTQHFGWTDPGPPVRLENIQVYAVYGLAVGIIMYIWTRHRLQRDRRRREADHLAQARQAAYDDRDRDGDAPGQDEDGRTP